MTKDTSRETGQFKTCARCGETKPIEQFGVQARKKDGRRGACKDCHKAYAKGYRQENRDLVNERTKKWRVENPDKAKASNQNWRVRNPERQREIVRNYYKNNPEKWEAYIEKRHENPHYRIDSSIRAGINKSIKRGTKGGRRRNEILGYTTSELCAHLEKQFLPGMTWANYGEWHIDHIVPLSAHNYETPDDIDFKKAWALSNLQPLWAPDNIKKGARLSSSFQPSLAF